MTPKQANNVKIGIGITAGIVVLYLLSKATDNGGTQTDPTGNTGNPNGGGGTFNVMTATAKLYELMRYNGSDETKIVNFFRFVTPSQFRQIKTQFGTRQYNKTLGNQENPLAWFTELPYEPLEVWLEEELSDKQFGILQSKYPNDL